MRRQFQKYIERHYFNWQINLQPKKNILFFGDPRGGTTWMAETLSTLFHLPILWEPMLPRKDSRFKKFGFASRQYLPEDLEHKDIQNAFSDLFHGKGIDHWEIQHTSTLELKKAKASIIKFTRGNMLLPYLTKQFQFEKQPIYMLRNPMAVVASQLKHAGWDDMEPFFKIPNAPFNELYLHHKDFLASLTTKEEVLIAKWALTNKLVIDHPRHNKDWIFLTYEETLLNPKQSLQKVIDRWQVKDIDLNLVNFAKKSKTSANSKEIKVMDQLNHWKKSFSESQIQDMKNVLNYFQLKCN